MRSGVKVGGLKMEVLTQASQPRIRQQDSRQLTIHQQLVL